MLLIYTLSPAKTEARKIGKALVKHGLAACVNIVKTKSIFVWNGDLQEQDEYALLIKTTRERYRKVEEYIKKHHSYKIPCIVAFPVVRAYQPYKRWVKREVRSKEKKKTDHRVFQIVSLIPRGSVASYKTIAAIAGIKNPRLVGRILHTNTDPKSIPCHRVVRSDGTLAGGYAFGGASAQRKKLENEGIKFLNNRVMLSKHLWKPTRATA